MTRISARTVSTALFAAAVLGCLPTMAQASVAPRCAPTAAAKGAVLVFLNRQQTLRVAVAPGADASDTPLVVSAALRTSPSCWKALPPAIITGREAAGVRSKALSLRSIFAADADRDGRDELIILYSAYIDGTGDDAIDAAAIYTVTPARLQRRLATESKFLNVRNVAQFRARARR